MPTKACREHDTGAVGQYAGARRGDSRISKRALEPALRSGSAEGRILIADRAVEARVFRLVHLAHAPSPEGRLDDKTAESCACCQRHGLTVAVLMQLMVVCGAYPQTLDA
jgi:hypothetical protein